MEWDGTGRRCLCHINSIPATVDRCSEADHHGILINTRERPFQSRPTPQALSSRPEQAVVVHRNCGLSLFDNLPSPACGAWNRRDMAARVNRIRYGRRDLTIERIEKVSRSSNKIACYRMDRNPLSHLIHCVPRSNAELQFINGSSPLIAP